MESKSYSISSMKKIEWKDKSFFFSFPEFKGWGVESVQDISDSEKVIYFQHPKTIKCKVAPQVRIRKLARPQMISSLSYDLQLREVGLEMIPLDYSTMPTNPSFHVVLAHDPARHPKGFKPKPENWDELILITPTFSVSISHMECVGIGFGNDVFYQEIIHHFHHSNM